MSEKCKEKVWGDWKPRQCSRNAVKDGYCKQHHPDTVAERNRKVKERWQAKQEASPYGQLKKAKQQIAKLVELLDEARKRGVQGGWTPEFDSVVTKAISKHKQGE